MLNIKIRQVVTVTIIAAFVLMAAVPYCTGASYATDDQTAGPEITAKGAAVYCENTGSIIYSKNGDMVTVSEDFPRVVKTRIIKKDGNKYFGPYSDAGAVNQIVDVLSSIYSLKRCSALSFPDGHRPCLNYFIKECRGICAGEVSKEEYRKTIDEILQFLSGKDKPLLQNLTERMKAASDAMDYEDAAKWRDSIMAIKSLAETQRVTMDIKGMR